jgi:hypothetical protein
VPVTRLVDTIAGLPARGARPPTPTFPDLDATLMQLEQAAVDYAQLCRAHASCRN